MYCGSRFTIRLPSTGWHTIIRWSERFSAESRIGIRPDEHHRAVRSLQGQTESLRRQGCLVQDPDGRVRKIAAISLKFAREYRDFVKAKK
jgi:hypothetical protein